MSLLGLIGKALTFGADVVTGNYAGAVGVLAGSGSGSTGSGGVVMPGAGAMPVLKAGTSLSDALRRGLVAPDPTRPPLFPTANLPTPDSVKIQATNVGGLYQSGSATAYFTPTGNSQPVQTCAIKGYHLNRSGYWTKQGYVAPMTKCVKNRRRNALNSRALNRAISRTAAAKRYAKLLDRIEIKGGRRRRCA